MEHGVDFGAVLLAFGAALFGAKLFGELAERVGQPAVLGELLAGILLGPSVLGLVPLSDAIFVLAEIGVVLLLFEVGLETNLEDLVRVGAPALAVALAGMVLPFAGGYFVTRALGYETLTATFVGAALTATSIGITARVLSELKVLATREGQIILGAAVVDDVLGLVILAVVSKVAGGAQIDAATVAKSTGLAIGFLAVAIAVGNSARPRARRPAGHGRACAGCSAPPAWPSRSSSPGRPRRRIRRRSSARSRRGWRSRAPTGGTTSSTP